MSGNFSMVSILDPTAVVKARIEGARLEERLKRSSTLAEHYAGTSFEEILLDKELGLKDPSLALLGALKQADDERWEREHGAGSSNNSIFPDFIGKSSYLTNPAIAKFLAGNETANGVDSTLDLFDLEEDNLPALTRMLSLSGSLDETRPQMERAVVKEALEALGEESPLGKEFLRENILLAGLIAKHPAVAEYFGQNPEAAERIVAETSRLPALSEADAVIRPDLSRFSF